MLRNIGVCVNEVGILMGSVGKDGGRERESVCERERERRIYL